MPDDLNGTAPADKVIQADIVFAGGSIGCLTGAIAAAERGADVSLLLPKSGIGSGFKSLPHNHYMLDVGCRRFDFTPDATILDITEYVPGMRARPFAPHIKQFLENTVGLELTATTAPQMSYGGRFAADFATSLDLTSLNHLLGDSDVAQIRTETESLLAENTPPPFMLGQGNWPDLSSVTLQEASLANHGKTFHTRLIAAFAGKLFPDGWQTMPADLSAKIWTPLFFPRTIHKGCRGEIERDRADVTYFYPAEGAFGTLVERLMERINTHPRICVRTIGQITSLENSAGTYHARVGESQHLQWQAPLALGISVEHYCALAGLDHQVETLSLSVFWIEVSEADLLNDPSTIMVFNKETGIYRISTSGSGAPDGKSVLALEFGGAHEKTTEELARDLEMIGLLRTGADVTLIKQAPNVRIIAPSQANRKLLDKARKRHEDRGVTPHLIGTLNDLKADMLNDQTLQGLKLAASL